MARPAPSRPGLLLLGLVLLALAVRLWGLDFGLPDTRCRPDEGRIVRGSLQILAGDLDPHFFRYPSLFLYLLAALFGGTFLLGVRGRTSLPHFLGLAKTSAAPLHLLARLLSASLGAATVFLVGRLGERVGGRRVGLLAALFLALAYLHVRDSHFGVTDVSAAFFVVGAVRSVVGVLERPTTGRYVMAGVLAGLAASTKYVGILVFLPLVLAHALLPREQRRGSRPALFLLAFVAAFLLGTPFAVLDADAFLRDFLAEARHLGEGHLGIVQSGWSHHLSLSLWHGLGPGLFGAGLLGCATLLRQRPRRAVVLLAFPAAYFLTAGRGATAFVRYMVPVVPFLCITAAHAVDAAARTLARRGRIGPAVWSTALGLAIVAPSAASVVRLDRLLARDDTRLLATRWIREHVEAGASIHQAAPQAWATADLAPTDVALRDQRRRAEERGEPGLIDLVEGQLDGRRREGVVGYDLQGWDPGNLPQIVVLSSSPLEHYSRAPQAVEDLVARRYRLVHEVRGLRSGADVRYDRQDAFFVPFVGLDDVLRPGPDLRIYRLRP